MNDKGDKVECLDIPSTSYTINGFLNTLDKDTASTEQQGKNILNSSNRISHPN